MFSPWNINADILCRRAGRAWERLGIKTELNLVEERARPSLLAQMCIQYTNVLNAVKGKSIVHYAAAIKAAEGCF
jgi:hypothetical protein